MYGFLIKIILMFVGINNSIGGRFMLVGVVMVIMVIMVMEMVMVMVEMDLLNLSKSFLEGGIKIRNRQILI
jgi:high-affinity Fe2+/Pb2+ permease